MAQITIYLPDLLEKRLRRDAKLKNLSVSAYIANKLRGPAEDDSQDRLGRLFGSWRGDFPTIDDPPPDDVPAL